ncbi:hypothetical protein [Streptomyces sp. CB01635]|uniref:hypothetical protein n=1 Tax=unclassified Streptomyces TaxID=2593676 RepID=UPI001F43EB4E|nr:hypothetical protein [Streptomyces sp. CB01635]
MPRRVRKSVNVLLCLVAVAGIGWSGREIWQVWQGRHQIDEACAGIVPPGRVLALSPAGGTLSHRQADEGTIELDAGLPQDCEIFSTEAGEKHGTSSGERWFFTGTVGALPEQSVVTDDPLEELVDFNGDPTYPVQPLGAVWRAWWGTRGSWSNSPARRDGPTEFRSRTCGRGPN